MITCDWLNKQTIESTLELIAYLYMMAVSPKRGSNFPYVYQIVNNTFTVQAMEAKQKFSNSQ